MAVLQAVAGVAKNGVFTGATFTTKTITLGGAGLALDGSVNALRVTAIDADAWVWLSGDGSTDPRIYLKTGASFDFLDNLAGKTVNAKAYP